MIYTPYRHQQIAHDFLRSHDHAGLFLGMGLGKTVTTLTVLEEHLWDDFTVRQCLVIAPKNVAQNVWAQECRKWDHLNDIRCSVVMGDIKARRKALAAEAELYIINRENVVWLVEELGGTLDRFQMVVIDELSSFKSAQAKRWKALKRPIQPVRYVVGLTGTPAPNGYLDLWPQMYLIDGGATLGRKLGDYRLRYFSPGAHKGHVVYEWKLRLGAQDAINRLLKRSCLSMSAEDWLDLPEILYNTIPVSMSPSERKQYKKLEAEKVIPLLQESTGFRELDPRDPKQLAQMTSAIRGDTAAAVAGKLLQMAGGAVYDDEGAVIPFHHAKLDALAELLDTHEGENVLCFYNYQHEKERILSRFPQARAFSGPQDVEDWNAGKIPLLLCHPASAGHGLNLQQGGHLAVWYGLNWSLELYQQANKRLHRPGQKESVVIHHLCCKGTIDERVLAVLAGKGTTQDALLDALKGYLTKGEQP
jgi:SNF2 family DNA or RNA helicase